MWQSCPICVLSSAQCEQPSLVIQLKLVAPQFPDSSLSSAFSLPTTRWLSPRRFPSLRLQVCSQAHLHPSSSWPSFTAPVRSVWAAAEGKIKEDVVRYTETVPEHANTREPHAEHCTHGYHLSITSEKCLLWVCDCQTWGLGLQRQRDKA